MDLGFKTLKFRLFNLKFTKNSTQKAEFGLKFTKNSAFWLKIHANTQKIQLKG